ncbi:MAG: hypothetical protein M1839_001368 [Geoglossum umbratile]|nr:MAG: hypothetical protein M1839_001368 [Geoglossum umbratile]
MDSYPAYRRSPIEPRSPQDPPRWGGRPESPRSGVTRQVDDFYRRRSPGPTDRRPRPRNRSRSPPPIDRYQPDARIRDEYYIGSRDRDDRRRAPSPPPANIDRYVPGQDPSKPALVNPVPDPSRLEYQVGFSYFAEWWRRNEAVKQDRERARNGGRRASDRVKGDREVREEREKEKAEIQAAYDAYKEELQVKMARSFVHTHKGDEWFVERYVPEMRDSMRLRLAEFRRGIWAQWAKDLESGAFDEFSLEGIHKSESNGAGGVIEKEEGEMSAAAEVLAVGDLVPGRGGDIRDESVFQPTLLIKTIAPTVNRGKLEEFCREHLGELEGGFKWLSLSDPNPSKRFHRIGWVMLHPGAEPAVSTERGDGRDDDGEDGEDREEAVILIRSDLEGSGTSATANKALEAINGKTVHDEVRGDFTIHVGVHAPPREIKKKALWDLFSAPERIDKDLQLAMRLVAKFEEELGPEFNGLEQISDTVDSLKDKGWLQAPATGPVGVKTRRKSRSMDGGMGLDTDMDEGGEGAIDDEEEEGAYDEEVDDEELLVKKKKLDLLVEYLRRVFSFCFFCVFESDSVHELTRKCPGGHLRRPRGSLSTAAKAAARASAMGEPFPSKRRGSQDASEEAPPTPDQKSFPRNGFSRNEQQLQRAFNWVKTFEDKIMQLLEPEKIDVRKLGGKPVQEGVDEELTKHVKQEDENKWRCKVPECTKLFKAEVFWKKHVEKRHPEWLDALKRDFQLVNTYVIDPSHIAPSRTDANSNGHFPINNNHFPAGTPRGFNLANMPLSFAAPLPGSVFPPPPGFPPFFAPHAVPTPGNWGGPGTDFTAIDDRGQTGPLRRRNNGARDLQRGPYDRRPSRDVRWAPPPGRFSPPRIGGDPRRTGGVGGKWGDGAGGAAVGPREAVQGRSLKSYEDLDAVGGGGAGELNY